MSLQGLGTDIGTLKAGADLSARQFRFVKLDANGDVIQCSAAGEGAIGVLQNKPGIGQAATVRIVGVSKVVADAAVAVGALVKTSADGEATTASAAVTNTADAGGATDALIGSFVLGLTLKAAAGAGEIIPVLLRFMGAVPTTAA